MPSKLQMYEQMADQTAKQVTGSFGEWTAFLETMGRLYKYPFHEQLMIFAQKPNATACADYDLWNKQMGRYVRRGTKGIALIDTSGDNPKLKYVFDVSDTGTRANSRRLNLWEYRDEHQDAVTASLENRFGVSGEKGLADQLEQIAGKLVTEYWNDNRRDILGILEDSFLEEYDDYNVEITGRIAKQLYPKADITVAGFETTDRRDFYDLAIGNVPFGQYQVNDRAYNKLGFSIHDYFFAKALDQVRPGGVVAFVTSRYTMDKQSPEVRKYIAQRAELLGAIRLPNNAFKANAGTEVVSDIIFLQKRDRPIEIEPDWIHLGKNDDGFAINSYFIDHPEMILGRQTSESTQYGKQDFTVEPIEGLELADQLHDAVKYIRGTYTEAELPELGAGEAIDTSIPADPNVKNYSYTVVDGNVYYRENSRMVKPDLNAAAMERVKGMVELRDCVQKLIGQQMDGYTPDEVIRQTQRELNELYDNFTAKHGLINSRGNALAFADDSSYYLLCSLEVLDEDNNLKRKADMFTKRTIKPSEVVTSVDTASEALAVSIAEKTEEEYKMVPGYTIHKDPKTTVVKGSEECYLFVKVEKSANFDSYMTYEMADGWTALEGVEGVYYREVKTADMGTEFSVLKDDQVTVKGEVTKEMMAEAENNQPTLTITAYASQLYKNNTDTFTAAEAWANVPKN